MLSLFAGVGGIDLAAHWAGIKTVAFVEIDSFCRQVLCKHWPHVAQFEDICDVTAYTFRGIGPIDIIAGGVPCQDASIAGKRLGLAGERTTLWTEFARLIREIRPRYAVLENVSGLLSVNDGDFFTAILRDLAEMGYDAEWGVWGACDVGAPHKRERLFLLAYPYRDGCEERIISSVATGPVYATGGDDSGELANADLLEQHGSRGTRGRRKKPANRSAGEVKPGVGKSAHELPSRLDCARFVAMPGESQHDWEAPRVAHGIKNIAKPLKALGNAVNPLQIYPLFAAIIEAERGEL